MFHLDIPSERLQAYALELGSDCPFFIVNQPVHATGRGEIMEPVHTDLGHKHFLLINPGIHIHTGKAFAALDGQFSQPDTREVVESGIENWKDRLINDFEAPLSRQHPEIAGIKKILYDAGADYASMTGSGSTVFGIFRGQADLRAKFPADYFYKWC